MTLLATFKHISSKNADYGAAEAYLTFEHDEFTMKPTLDENGRLIPREDYRISSLNCGGEDFAVACMRANLRYEKNQKREDVKSHHYIISFDPRDGTDKVYDLDENGERIKLPSGRWKSHKENTVDWNDQKYCEIWRHEWEVIQNRYLEANNRPERVDLRSYARQGLDIVPTVHEGAAVRQMEKRGIQTNIGNLNREIRAANRLMKSIRQLIHNLKGWIAELGEKRKELLAQKPAEEVTLLPNLLMKYMEIRKEERKDWTRAGQNRGTSQDLKAVSEALSYLRQKGLSTVEDLEAFLESSGKSAADYRNQMKPKEARSKVIDGILASRTDCKECKPVYEKYQKIFFKKTKEKFKQEHPEVARYEKATAYLAKHPDDKDSTQKELQEEQETLLSEIAELKVPLTEVQEDLKKLRDIRYWVRKATPGTEESKEPPKKQSLKEVLQDKADEKKPQRTASAQTKHRQQDMEL